MSKNILIYGAGAIGRGYVPWLFKDEEVDLSFVESNQELRNNLLDQGSYTSFMTNDKGYDSLKVDFKDCLTEHDVNFSIYDGVITAVGPRQIFELRDSLSKFDCPVLFFENDSSLPDQLASLTGSSNFYFGIPDVITSNTAPDKLLDHDPLSITTESGISFADQSAFQIGGDIQYVETKELWKQWMAKLYMHNTPHCIAAYLGSLYNQDYLHEGMSNNSISKIVEGSMIEMGQTISKIYGIDEDFVKWYGDKELQRFSNKLLFDPISRVAREPFRKLGLTNRLIGAAQLCLSAGIIPKNIIIGIMAAFLYDEKNDNDFNIKILIDSLSPKQFMMLIINIKPHEALFHLLIENWAENLNFLNNLKNG